MTNKNIKKLIQQNLDEMVAFRRDLHRHPELPWEEFRTTDRIAQELDKIGIAYRRTEPTGIIAEIEGGKPGKRILLRADIDALPVQELSENIDYKSMFDGKMHACGHDTHASMLLAAARVLYKIREQLKGNVRLVFQPAEEIAQGAKSMVKQGVLDGIDSAFGMHIWSQMPVGKISCVVGSSFASADLLTVRFKGRGGHGSMPHDTVDAVMVASAFVMNVQSIVSREISPLDPAVVTIGRMDVGTRFNVIAENAVLEGTVRCFNITVRDKIESAIRRYANQIAAMYRATAEVEYIYGTLPVINDKESALLAQKVIVESFGEQALYFEAPTTGGEDFSYYTENIPGAFALVGSGNPDKDTQWPHHHGCFNVDEDGMALGTELYAQYAWSYLNQN
ncbi:amidohydrolase [Gilliamella sp. B2776]|uniref:M20 family metallopeptidase n=1 Tax=unclassified Gilliamella TaxID=2685620 RepID=UPI00226A1D32|nr:MULTISPECIES: M20 family metallopeptidase [unclassified Gilliamella]MCX8649485.1 amidohydrolase [Gilliamella sp. B2779]MCX8654529.1 amidohydrolase [Gilliamella sp. B2737]MCX8692204.1 amidohydrolase [Gilliamella sp. B2776]MCX8703430.1 amidohydrolase [Gilliamella sp. B2781]WDM18488.1 amidohydrolase [Gilliamella sp. B3022]